MYSEHGTEFDYESWPTTEQDRDAIEILESQMMPLDSSGVAQAQQAQSPELRRSESVRFRLYPVGERNSGARLFTGRDHKLQRNVMVKALPLEDFEHEYTNFYWEAMATGHVTHPAFVRPYSFFAYELGNQTYAMLMMELVEGQSVGETLEDMGRFTLGQALSVVDQLAEAVDQVAEDSSGGRKATGNTRGELLHLDLQMKNIMITNAEELIDAYQQGFSRSPVDIRQVLAPDQEVPDTEPEPTIKIIDWGGSSWRERDPYYLYGNLLYMPPERLMAGDDTALLENEVFSTAVIFYELVTGEKFFTSNIGLPELRTEDIRRKIVESEYPTQAHRQELAHVLQVSPEKLDPLMAVLNKALDKSLEMRYGSVTEFYQELERACQGLY